MTTTHYETLLVAATATDQEIRAAFRRQARTYHPDIAGELGAVTMRRLNEAFAVLKTAESRTAYDLSLARPAPEPVAEEASADWGVADDDWDDAVVDEPITRDTDRPSPFKTPVVEKRLNSTRVGISISITLLLIATLVILYFQWSTRTVSMGNWRLTIVAAVAAALVQTFKRSFGPWLTGILALTTLCWPGAALGWWVFTPWSEAVGLPASIALTAIGPITWALRLWFNGLRQE